MQARVLTKMFTKKTMRLTFSVSISRNFKGCHGKFHSAHYYVLYAKRFWSLVTWSVLTCSVPWPSVDKDIWWRTQWDDDYNYLCYVLHDHSDGKCSARLRATCDPTLSQGPAQNHPHMLAVIVTCQHPKRIPGYKFLSWESQKVVKLRQVKPVCPGRE